MGTIVIGAGPAGLTAAYQLAKGGQKVTVFEAASAVGGLARSFPLWDQIVDVGPHRFFSHDRRVNELWLEVVGKDYQMVNRQTRILYQGKLFQYPLNALDTLAKLGTLETVRCIASYAAQTLSPGRDDGSFETWVSRRFGRRLFEIFFKTYSEKLWGISCEDLDADFAAQRIKKFSLSEAIKGALLKGSGDKHRTLVDKFAYPLAGTGMVYERMADIVRDHGGSVHLNTPVSKILLKNGRAVGVELASGQIEESDHVISTMPLTLLISRLDGVPSDVIDACRQLQFRNTVLVYLEVLNENPFTDNWVYVHSPDLALGRVTNFRNWVPHICGKSDHTILALEYWCQADDEFWRRDDAALGNLARDEICRSGLVNGSKKLGRTHVLRIPRSYPIYRRGYREHLRTIQEHLRTLSGIQVIGRYGSFKYNNQDHSILMGRLAAENILRESTHNLWSVNTDYETYQESCSISESGLVAAAGS